MAKLFTIFVIVALLVCSTTLTNAARPLTPSNHQDNATENVKVDENESCNGVNEEECLMRRTLVAHTDYIYTQNQNP